MDGGEIFTTPVVHINEEGWGPDARLVASRRLAAIDFTYMGFRF